MPGKDPAFLFYSLNWLQGTASMKPEEKGVYIDLLSHQHQSGSIPNDPGRLCRMVGLSEKEFLPIWSTIRLKFVNRPDNRLVNLKLEEVMTERSTKRSTTDHTKAILSRFAVLVRTFKKTAPDVVERIKENFQVSYFEPFEILEATERLNKWFTEQLTSRSTIRSPTRVETENTNTGNRDVGGGKGGGEGEGEDWNPFPGPSDCRLVLPEIKAASTRQLMHLNGHTATEGQVAELWEVFKVQNFTGSRFYSSDNEAFSHFMNWSKTQKVNGTSQVNGSGVKSGTSTDQVAALERLRHGAVGGNVRPTDQ